MIYKFVKRTIDIVLSLIVVVLFLPFAIPILIGLKLTGEGEIWYKQSRVGYKNEMFNILKFATMLKNSPSIGTGSLTLRNDPRITPMGGFLRKSKINELPQVINVLAGDMALVGPRPQMVVDFEAYSPDVQQRIYNSPPGITGIGSIIFRDEEKFLTDSGLEPKIFYKEVIAPYKGAVEVWYHENASILTDIKLIFLTAWVIVSPNSNLVFSLFKNLPPLPKELYSDEYLTV